jgi:phosphopantothenoylcysteine decarboxylase / phosphopantothenate---cysteine ligase
MARVLLGVSGGIAAYKSVELARLLIGAGHAVRVVQTRASLRFVGKATFEGITGAPVLVEEFDEDPSRGAYPGEPVPAYAPIGHLALAQRCEVYVVAPATATTLAKLATGLADGMLTAAALASEAPLVLAPAMNDRMYAHPATQANLATLRARGARVVPPETGPLASHGEWGTGRLADPATIAAAVEQALPGARYAPRSLDGLRVLVTAGGTREPIDAVRFVGNRSSGRMGFAVAEEAARRGAEVTVVAANVSLPRSDAIAYRDVESAAALEREVRDTFLGCDVLVMAAAVADFRPASPERSKISKSGRESLSLQLVPTADVLSGIAELRRPGQTVVGFAAEHGTGALERAREKLERKGLDAIVLNDVSDPSIGFDSPDNEVTILSTGGGRSVPRDSKDAVAAALLDAIEEMRGQPAARPDEAASSAADQGPTGASA